MDEKDREIFRLLQADFPLTSEPFQVLGDKLWMDEMSVISRLVRLTQTGIIRYFGAFFNSRKLGYSGTLAAMEVPEDRIDQVAAVLNRFPGITHNYLREGLPNIWFTLIAKSKEELLQIIETIKKETGIQEILLFPTTRQFKIRTDMA